MRILNAYILEQTDAMDDCGERIRKAAYALGCRWEFDGAHGKTEPLGWPQAVRSHNRIFCARQFTDEDVAKLRDGCLKAADLTEKLVASCYWPKELYDAKEQAARRMRDEVATLIETFNAERPDR